tara:strand:- start:203 stop:754 length:552 start_codon:yes stop_codon:yes gene_type:complete
MDFQQLIAQIQQANNNTSGATPFEQLNYSSGATPFGQLNYSDKLSAAGAASAAGATPFEQLNYSDKLSSDGATPFGQLNYSELLAGTTEGVEGVNPYTAEIEALRAQGASGNGIMSNEEKARFMQLRNQQEQMNNAAPQAPQDINSILELINSPQQVEKTYKFPNNPNTYTEEEMEIIRYLQD